MMKKDCKNIIIADDSKVFLEGLQLILSDTNQFNIIDVCHNGIELIESPKLYEADLILSDIEMPYMNGIESGKRINFKHPDLSMIALTMHIENIFLEEIIMAGYRGFVYKPHIPLKLINVINQVLTNKYVFPDNLKLKLK